MLLKQDLLNGIAVCRCDTAPNTIAYSLKNAPCFYGNVTQRTSAHVPSLPTIAWIFGKILCSNTHISSLKEEDEDFTTNIAFGTLQIQQKAETLPGTCRERQISVRRTLGNVFLSESLRIKNLETKWLNKEHR